MLMATSRRTARLGGRALGVGLLLLAWAPVGVGSNSDGGSQTSTSAKEVSVTVTKNKGNSFKIFTNVKDPKAHFRDLPLGYKQTEDKTKELTLRSAFFRCSALSVGSSQLYQQEDCPSRSATLRFQEAGGIQLEMASQVSFSSAGKCLGCTNGLVATGTMLDGETVTGRVKERGTGGPYFFWSVCGTADPSNTDQNAFTCVSLERDFVVRVLRE